MSSAGARELWPGRANSGQVGDQVLEPLVVYSHASGGADEPPEQSTSTSISTAPTCGLPEHVAATSPAWKGRKGVRRREMQGCAGGRCRGAPSMRDSRNALAGDVGVSVDAGQQG
jgi:hypothetical protein